MSASAPSLFDFTPQFPRLEVVDADDQRSIPFNGHLAGRYLSMANRQIGRNAWFWRCW